MELHDAIIDFLSVFPEGNPIIIKNMILKYPNQILIKNLQELTSLSNDNYTLLNIALYDSYYHTIYYTVLDLIKNEIMIRITESSTIIPSTLSINAIEFIPNVYKTQYDVCKLSSNSIKHIKNMLNNPYIIKHNKSITIDHILMNNHIKPMYYKDIMIQLIKSSNEFSYDDSTTIIKLLN
jgi:hypothetical protein